MLEREKNKIFHLVMKCVDLEFTVYISATGRAVYSGARGVRVCVCVGGFVNCMSV